MRKTIVAMALVLVFLPAIRTGWAHGPGQELEAKVVRVVDGDTIKVRLLGRMPRCFRSQSVRLRHCNAPELRDKRPDVAAKAQEAKTFVAARIAPGMRLTLHDVGREKYGRLLADVEVRGQNLCRSLVEAGLAVPYEGGKREW